MPEAAETLLGFDFGTRRIGVAIGNSISGTARPLAQIEAPNQDGVFAQIGRLIQTWQPQRLIVGRPLHPDGVPHAMTVRCERFSRQLAGRFRLPVALVDERYSTTEAESTGGGGSSDARAAAIILRQYLDARP